MTNYNPTTANHATLTANTVDTVTFPVDAAQVEVLNRGAAELYFTVKGDPPSIGGADTYVVPAGGALKVDTGNDGINYATVVKVISAAATAYSVTVV